MGVGFVPYWSMVHSHSDYYVLVRLKVVRFNLTNPWATLEDKMKDSRETLEYKKYSHRNCMNRIKNRETETLLVDLN
jgi:hypothetical protein